MSVVAPKPAAVRTSARHRPATRTDLLGRQGESARERAARVVDAIRETMARAGVGESRSEQETGFYFAGTANGEMSVQYHHTGAGEGPLSRKTSRHVQAAFLRCCSELVASDHAFTLFRSARTVALHIILD